MRRRAAVPAGAAALIHHPWDGQVYLYTWLYRSEASVCCHCFCFSAFLYYQSCSTFALASNRFSFSPPIGPVWWFRHDSIVYNQPSVDTPIFGVVSGCLAGTDAVHPYTATSRVRFIRTSKNPWTERSRAAVG